MDRTTRIRALLKLDYFLHWSQLSKVVCGVAATIVLLAIIYTVSYYQIVTCFLQKDDRYRKKRLSYQITNFCANLMLAVAGLYYEYRLTPKAGYVNIEKSVSGFTDYYMLSAFQLGYQLWALPIGLFAVGESSDMLVHHIAVLLVAFMSGCMTNGFRIYTPFFYGILEVSSLPLSVMSMFKDNPDWIQKSPNLYSMVRIVFAAAFLYVRIYMYVPRNFRFLRDHLILWTGSNNWIYMIYMSLVWSSSLFLMLLQFHWARLIIMGIVKMFASQDKMKTYRKENVRLE